MAGRESSGEAPRAGDPTGRDTGVPVAGVVGGTVMPEVSFGVTPFPVASGFGVDPLLGSTGGPGSAVVDPGLPGAGDVMPGLESGQVYSSYVVEGPVPGTVDVVEVTTTTTDLGGDVGGGLAADVGVSTMTTLQATISTIPVEEDLVGDEERRLAEGLKTEDTQMEGGDEQKGGTDRSQGVKVVEVPIGGEDEGQGEGEGSKEVQVSVEGREMDVGEASGEEVTKEEGGEVQTDVKEEVENRQAQPNI